MYKFNFFGKKIRRNDLGINASFTNKKMHEEDVMKEGTMPILNILNKNNNQLLLDIGANTGSYCFMPLIFNNFKCHAYEPVNHIYNKLKENIDLNNCNDKIEHFNIGISNKNENKLINLSSNDQGGINNYGTNPKFFRPHIKKFNKTQNTVVKSLDTLYENTFNIISYLKIDTEGYEFFVLDGAKNLIKKFRPIIQMEWNECNMKQCDIKYTDLIGLIRFYKYIPLFFIGEELFIIPIEKYKNYKHLKKPLNTKYKDNKFWNWINNFSLPPSPS